MLADGLPLCCSVTGRMRIRRFHYFGVINGARTLCVLFRVIE